jgi:hypothetical protein
LMHGDRLIGKFIKLKSYSAFRSKTIQENF